MINICFLDEYSVHGADLSRLQKLGNYQGYDYTEKGEVSARSVNADVIIVNKTRITSEIMRGLPLLKLICVAATGMNNIDLEAAKTLGIAVKNAADYSTHSVAETTFAGALSLYRQTLYYDKYVKDGAYEKADRLFHFGRPISELYGKHWGIIGLGNIGRCVAGIAAAFGAKVSCYSASGAVYDTQYPQLPLEELLGTCDIVSIHTPLTQRTRNLLDYPQLSLMKPTAIIANVSRGTIINDAALARCLNEGKIAGAVLDVFSHEPINEGNPLLHINDPYKLVLSPHCAWASAESIQRLVDCIERNIKEFFKMPYNQN